MLHILYAYVCESYIDKQNEAEIKSMIKNSKQNWAT